MLSGCLSVSGHSLLLPAFTRRPSDRPRRLRSAAFKAAAPFSLCRGPQSHRRSGDPRGHQRGTAVDGKGPIKRDRGLCSNEKLTLKWKSTEFQSSFVGHKSTPPKKYATQENTRCPFRVQTSCSHYASTVRVKNNT